MPTISFADCRAAARAVAAAEHGREGVAAVRPRSVLGIVAARGPLPLILFVAAAEGRFVRRAPDSFVILERPLSTSVPRALRGGPWLRLLRAVDHRWDVLLFAGPPAVALGTAAVLALLSALWHTVPPFATLWLAVAAAAYACVFMVAQVLYGSAWVKRTLGRTPRARDDLAAESLPGWNWSMPLVHHVAAGGGRSLLHAAADRMVELVEQQVRWQAAQDGAETDRLRVREILVCPVRGVTTTAMRGTVRRALDDLHGGESQVAVRMPRDRVAGFRQPPQASGGFLALWIAGVAIIVAVVASFVPEWERLAAPAGDCAQRPTTYTTALLWLAWRLLGQNAPNIVPGSMQTIGIGWLLTLVGIMTIPVTWLSVRLAINAHQNMLADFRTHQGRDMDRTRIMLLTVTRVERDAVLAAMREVVDEEPEHSFGDNVVVYELGSTPGARIGMAQCARTGAGSPGGAQAVATEVIQMWKPDFVIMVGICYGLREDETPPQRLADVIVGTTVSDLDKRIEYEDHIELLGDRVSSATVLIQRLQAASTRWHQAPVHFGQILSAQILVDSTERRNQLKRDHSRAVGGEMEAHGLYAAAADARVPWIVVKAISDWGVERDRYYLPVDAARNAASFVAQAISDGAFDRHRRESP